MTTECMVGGQRWTTAGNKRANDTAVTCNRDAHVLLYLLLDEVQRAGTLDIARGSLEEV